MFNCWDLKGCPASHYHKCQAYENSTSCWEIKNGCLCPSYGTCQNCPIYKQYISAKENPEANV